MATDPNWYRTTFASAWATFGYMNTAPPSAAWAIECLVLVGLLACTILALGATNEGALSRRKGWTAVGFAAVTFAMLLIASVGYSWIVDCQAQGRYLLPGVVLYAVALGGVRAHGTGRAPRIQKGLIAFHVALGWAVTAYLGGHIAPPTPH